MIPQSSGSRIKTSWSRLEAVEAATLAAGSCCYQDGIIAIIY
jgi:hypothetical protein